MSTLLILRPEIFSICIMIFLIVYDRYCAQFRNDKDFFFKFALVCLAHCVMALVTEITVNMDSVPKLVNDVCHMFFFLFSLLYSLLFFEYTLSQILAKGKVRRNIMIVSNIVSGCCILAMMLSPIEYINGANTRYSAGFGPTLCYTLGFVFFIAADIIIVVNRKRIPRSFIRVVLPVSLMTLGLLVVQILVPEFLYTAQALTLTAVGLFFAIENPIGKFQSRAFVDANAQIWNRNCYEYDMERFVSKKTLLEGSSMTFVVGDINGLKAVNDNLGHIEGDKLIEKIARSLQQNLASSHKVYRVGGDEFIALYLGTSPEVVEREVGAVEKECCGMVLKDNIPVGLSLGFATGFEGESYQSIYRRAEQLMYESKRRYYQSKQFDRRTC